MTKSKILVVSQSQDASFIDTLCAYEGAEFTVISGKTGGIACSTVEMPHYESASFKTKLASWLAFRRKAHRWMKKNLSGYDAVFFTSNPPVNRRLVSLAKKKNKKIIYLVWDIYPDVIERVFGRKSAPLCAVWKTLAHRMYRRCDRVITIGEAMKQTFSASYPGISVDIIPYHADTQRIRPLDKNDNPFARDNGLCDKKVFMYSGKMGIGHGFSSIMKAAEILSDRKDIVFLMIGFGPAYAEIEAFIVSHPEVNMRLMGYQPVEMLPYTLSCADAAFITIKSGTDGTFLPSKVYDAMAAGSAVISISDGDNDIRRMTEKYGVGVNIPDEASAVADAVVSFADNAEKLSKCRLSARSLAESYSAERIAAMYAELFAAVLNETEKEEMTQ